MFSCYYRDSIMYFQLVHVSYIKLGIKLSLHLCSYEYKFEHIFIQKKKKEKRQEIRESHLLPSTAQKVRYYPGPSYA